MDDELLKEFLVECHENLERLDSELVKLEKSPSDLKLLASIFRTVHTIKGSCGFFGFEKLQSVTHVGENLLGLLRDGVLSVSAEISTALLQLNDAIRQMLQQIETDGTEGKIDYSALVRRLEELKEPPASQPLPKTPEAKPFLILPKKKKSNPGVKKATVASSSETPVTPSVSPAPTPPPEPAAPIAEEPASPAAVVSRVEKVDAAEANTPEATDIADAKSVADQSIRVDVGLLDKLMNLVGELVLTRNQILQATSNVKDAHIAKTTQRLNLITTELQESVMKTRMQQIKTIWNRFPRLIRDTALYCNKQVRLEMIGGETELDRSLLEAIRDPLTHILRNSVDHGIESPEKRLAAGKVAEGTVTLKAFHEGGQVIIEVSDDGGGISPRRILDKALEKGLISRDEANRMSEREALQLIFLPGFSTAEKVTNVSGRGVGMDVVRTNIEKIGGSVDLQSRPGQGTTLRIKIPLTLAIVPALIIEGYRERYAIPQVSLVELLRLEGEAIRRKIEYIFDSPVYRLRGQLLPLVDLNKELGLPTSPLDERRGELLVVVLQLEGRQFGLLVDGIFDTQEIVVKPLGRMLKDIPVFAGATIMGDGQVALILDVAGIAKQSSVFDVHREKHASDSDCRQDRVGARKIMVMQLGNRRIAMPLDMVSRLEEISQQSIEQASGREVVQYRGDILPIVRLNQYLGERDHDHYEYVQVVVYSENNRKVGLVVDQILDIIEETPTATVDSRQSGVDSTMIVSNKVTDLLDVRDIIRAFEPTFFGPA